MSREHIPLFFRIHADSLINIYTSSYLNVIGCTFYHGFASGRFVFLLFSEVAWSVSFHNYINIIFPNLSPLCGQSRRLVI